MNPAINVMKMHFKEKWSWFFAPWIILLSSFLINLFVGYLTSGDEPIYTGGLCSIFAYMLVLGIVTLTHMFHFAIGLSVRRNDFYLGTSGMFFVVSAGIAVLLLLFAFFETTSGGWGVQLHFFHLPYLNDGSLIEQFLLYFVAMLNMFFLGFMVSSIYQRFGQYGLFVFFGALLVLFSCGTFLCTYYGWWMDVFHWIGQHTAFGLSMWTLPFLVIYIIVSYLFIRRTTV
ncbi:hypothetical protein JOD43_001896 [Pullulanibacillus pueri]|uniref:Uncharacterized protein n=1 Tax=Pullulanibacillus pueri TaxID=1437324 RepID=A0A8J3EMU7_9BACL|nr:hypothetical protein [Pullulanibacillus pueri]MBM7681724.1 hypothetical protein [Pullulanibacillus pueri]GGH84057.1 hypothetical protein GCM10007096_26250 [Pullulanibacillus pueri]